MIWYLLALLALAVMILCHEGGHFLAGRLCNVPVSEFALGFGKMLFHFKDKNGTVFSLRLVPFGGFCAFGEPGQDEVSASDDPALEMAEPWKRIVVSVAGPLANLLLALLVLFFLFLPAQHQKVHCEVLSVNEGSTVVGVLQPGDQIVALNGEALHDDIALMRELLQPLADQEVSLDVLRNGEGMTLLAVPQWSEDEQRPLFGVSLVTEEVQNSVFDAAKIALEEFKLFSLMVYDGLTGIVQRRYHVSEMSGVVGAVQVMGDTGRNQSTQSFLILCCLISVNLGLFNLIPFPALDGWRVVTSLTEWVVGKRINKSVQEAALKFGFLAVLLLMTILMVVDVSRIMSGLIQ